MHQYSGGSGGQLRSFTSSNAQHLHMVPNGVPEAADISLDFFCTPLGLLVLGTHSCGGAIGKASKLRNKRIILSVPGGCFLVPYSLNLQRCFFSPGASMAVIDDNMHTAWRSVQIEYLRREIGRRGKTQTGSSPEKTRPTPTAS